MTALPADIAAYTKDGVLVLVPPDAVEPTTPGSKNGADSPIETFYDLASDTQAMMEERYALLSLAGRLHEFIEIQENSAFTPLLTGTTPAIPRIKVTDTARGVSQRALVRSLGFADQGDKVSIELVGIGEVVGAPPPAKNNRYIAPQASGDQSGSDWSNAAPLSAINSMIAQAAAIGGEVLLRADAGPYFQDSVRTLSNGNTTIRGVDTGGNDMMAELVGSRMVDATGTRKWNAKADTAAGVYGKEVFRLNAGCNNLTFKFLHFRNQGRGCIRARQAQTNLVVTDCKATNVAAFITNDAASGAGTPTVTGFTCQRCEVRGFSKFAIKLETGDSHDILIEDFIFDSERQDGDNFASGIVFDGTAHDIIIRRGEIRNIIDSINTYQNGDGIAGEKRNNNILVENVLIEVCTDGGVDFKGDNIVMRNCTIRFCHRNYRLWGYATLINCIGENPGDNAGFNKYAKANVSVFDFGMVRVIGGRYTQTNTTSPVFRVEKGGMCSVSPSTVIQTQGATYSVEAVVGTNPAGAFIWMDPNDFVAPTITSSLSLSLDENKLGIFTITTSKTAQLRVVGGPAAKYFTTYGTQLRIARRDFEKPPADVPDNIYRVDIQVMDGNGNLSAINRVAVTINDVADDPITPQILISQYGVSKGSWCQIFPENCWQDTARTMPAEVDRQVALIDDSFGFGTYAYQDDPDQQAYLRQIGAVYFLEMTGSERYAIGAPGYFNFAEVTASFMLRREDENGQEAFRVVFTNPRNVDPATSSNYRWGLTVRDGQSFTAVFNSSNYTANTTKATVGSDKVLSIQSKTRSGRSNAEQMFPASPLADITMTNTVIAQAYIGGNYTGSSNMYGRLYGWIISNVTLDPATALFRTERQLTEPTGTIL